MKALSKEFKHEIIKALLKDRVNFEGTDGQYATKWQIGKSVYSQLKRYKTAGLLRDQQWLAIARELDVKTNKRQWKMARTEVFSIIEEDIMFCKRHSKSKIYVDECGIGKTYTARYLSRHMKNCFYVDCSQGKTKMLFIKLIARAIGIEPDGKYNDVKANVKYFLTTLDQPILIFDEAGDLTHEAMLDLKEIWNATEGVCGFYLMGADGLKHKISTGILHSKVGYRELFSRYSEKYTSVVPRERTSRVDFFRKLITDVLTANMEDTSGLNEIVKRCLTDDTSGNIGGLRRAESILILNREQHAASIQ